MRASSNEVNRLVRKKAVGDVAVADSRRRAAPNPGSDLVVDLVALLEGARDRDRVRHAGLVHVHGLEAALERGVALLDVHGTRRASRRSRAARHGRASAAGWRRRPRPPARPPTIVWSSSMNRTTWPAASAISFSTRRPVLEFSPVLGPATRAPMSSEITRRPAPRGRHRNDAGARPSAIAVLPRRLADQDRVVLGAAAQSLDRRAGSRHRGRSRGRACPAPRPRSGHGRSARAPGTSPPGSGRSRGRAAGFIRPEKSPRSMPI